MTTQNILYVATVSQKALFDFELKGQISDGMWEGARPFDHWKVWCKAEVVVSNNPEPLYGLGRTFYTQKHNYNFANKDLVDICGKRMIGYVRLALIFGMEFAKKYEGMINIEGNFVLPTYEGDFYDELRVRFGNDGKTYGYTDRKEFAKHVAERIENFEGYGLKELRKDLRDLKDICRWVIKKEAA